MIAINSFALAHCPNAKVAVNWHHPTHPHYANTAQVLRRTNALQSEKPESSYEFVQTTND